MDRPKGPVAVLLLIKSTFGFQGRRGTVSGQRKLVYTDVSGYSLLLYGAGRCVYR